MESIFSLIYFSAGMFDWIWDVVTSVLKRVVAWVLDVFSWVWELVYSTWNEIASWFMGLVGDILLRALEAVGKYVPRGLMDAITASFEWLEYIDSWVPIRYCIDLLLATGVPKQLEQ